MVGVVCLSAVNCGLLDIWTQQPTESAEVNEMMRWFWPEVTAEITYSTGRDYYQKLLKVIEVKSQDLTGIKHYTFDAAPTKCQKGDVSTREELEKCELDDEEVSSLSSPSPKLKWFIFRSCDAATSLSWYHGWTIDESFAKNALNWNQYENTSYDLHVKPFSRQKCVIGLRSQINKSLECILRSSDIILLISRLPAEDFYPRHQGFISSRVRILHAMKTLSQLKQDVFSCIGITLVTQRRKTCRECLRAAWSKACSYSQCQRG